MTYILPHEAKQTLSFWYELLGSFRNVNRSRSWCFKIFQSRSLKNVTPLIPVLNTICKIFVLWH